MRELYFWLSVVLLCCLGISSLNAEITVLKSSQVLYHKTPKLLIRGSGFDASDAEILIVIGEVDSLTPLVQEKDFILAKHEDGVILTLLEEKSWIKKTNSKPPIKLVLSSVTFKSNPRTNLLVDPVVVAYIHPVPSVKTSEVSISQDAPELKVIGIHFMGSSKIDFFFKPELLKTVAYEDVSAYPIGANNEATLRLKPGQVWRAESGPLVMIGVDTGAGPVRVGGVNGVQVATIVQSTMTPSVVATVIPSSAPTAASSLRSVKVEATAVSKAPEAVVTIATTASTDKDPVPVTGVVSSSTSSCVSRMDVSKVEQRLTSLEDKIDRIVKHFGVP